MKQRSIMLMGVLLVAVGLAGYGVYAKYFAVKVTRRDPAGVLPAPESNVLHYAPAAPQLANLRIQAVADMPEPASEPLPARIAYDESHTTRVSSPVAGRVIRLGAQAGDKVAAGQPLLWLDSPDYGSAIADAAKAEADLQLKQSAYARAKMLFEGEVLARKDLETAEADLHQSRAEAQRAALKLRNYSQAGSVSRIGERYALRAPISGVVTERQVNPGMEVRPDAQTPLFVITDPARLWVVIDLPETVLGKAHPGQAVAIEVDAFPGETFQARVLSVGTALDPVSRRAQIRCELANPDRRLKPEMFARATLIADTQHRVLRVPNSALIVTGLYYFVFVETAPGNLEKRRVAVTNQNRDYSIVTQGLKAGERIVSTGALLLNSELAGGA